MSKNAHRLGSRVVILAIGTCVSVGMLAAYVGFPNDVVRPQVVTHTHRVSSDIAPTRPVSSVPLQISPRDLFKSRASPHPIP